MIDRALAQEAARGEAGVPGAYDYGGDAFDGELRFRAPLTRIPMVSSHENRRGRRDRRESFLGVLGDLGG